MNALLLALPLAAAIWSARAEEAAAPPPAETPRVFGQANADARIVITARQQVWVRVRDAENRIVFMRIMNPGESWRAPNRSDLVLDTGNAPGLSVTLDGAPAPAFAPPGQSVVRRDLSLDPERLGQQSSPSQTTAAPVQAAATPAPVAAAALSPPPARVVRPAPTPNTVAAAGDPIRLETNKGTLVRLRGQASTVFVADPEIADVQVKSPGLLYVYARRPGETVLYAVDEGDRVLLASPVTVRHNLEALRAGLRVLAPDAAVDVASIDSTLLLTGAVGSAAEAENIRRLAARFAPEPGALVNQMQVVAPNQVNLRVRIAEVSRSTLRELGFNWDAVLTSGTFAFGLAAGAPALAAGQFVTRNRNATGNGNTNSFFAGNRGDLNGVIDALANEGLITVLAEPNLTALSGETASFLAGGEFPIPVPQNASTITIQFKKFGVGLSFVPTLLAGDRINMKVRPEVSQLSNTGAVQINGFQIPALTTRRAETTVELGSGQSFAIAGLLQNNSQQDISKVPLLGDIPVLGQLFRSDRFRRNETELAIIVTPYIVRPSSNRLLAPTDGLATPNDGERMVRAAAWRAQTGAPAPLPVGPDNVGPVGGAGFIVE